MLHIPISVNCHTTKSKRSLRLHTKLTRVYVRLGWDAPSLSRGVLRAVFVEYNWKTLNETADIWQVQYENETTKELLSYINCMHYKDYYITE